MCDEPHSLLTGSVLSLFQTPSASSYVADCHHIMKPTLDLQTIITLLIKLFKYFLCTRHNTTFLTPINQESSQHSYYLYSKNFSSLTRLLCLSPLQAAWSENSAAKSSSTWLTTSIRFHCWNTSKVHGSSDFLSI